MRKIISPKNIYQNYFDLLSSKVSAAKPIKIAAIFFMGGLLFLLIVAILKEFGKTSIFSLPNYAKIVESFCLALVFIGLLPTTIIVSCIFLWFQKFELIEGKIIDYFPNKNIFEIKDIQRIVLETPRSANVFFKRPGTSILKCVFWFGNSEDEWLQFISDLEKIDKEVINKCYFISSRKPGAPFFQASSKECFQAVLKLFDGIKRY